MDLIIGSHVSFKKDSQLLGSVKEAISYNANALMLYTGAPQNTKRSDINSEYKKEAINLMKENNIKLENVIAHAPYIINLANNKKEESYKFAINFLKEEINRCEKLGITKLVLHPGSFVSLTKEEGLDNIVSALNIVLKEEQKVKICLETMAGKGTEIGRNIDEIKYIIDNVLLNDKLLVCIDTCHLNDSGIDINNFDSYLKIFDRKIGIDKIGCIHINDSKNELNSNKDRHENIGFGKIGFDKLIKVIYNEKLKDVPKILETPYVKDEEKKSYPPYKFEIKMIRSKNFNKSLIEDIIKFYKKN